MSRPLPTAATLNDEDSEIIIDTDESHDIILETHSTHEQSMVENICKNKLQDWLLDESKNPNSTFLSRNIHTAYLQKGLQELSPGYSSLDASRPWIVFWIVHSLSLLDVELPQEFVIRCINFLNSCQHPCGGFGGGPGQIAHLAPTYAAVAALFELSSQPGGTNALTIINRNLVYAFLLRVKHMDGGFRVTEDGECDTRGAYTALAVASMLNIITPELIAGTPEWIASCQTYEGGIGGEPGNEAHGGYAYCGLASLIILNRTDLLDLNRLLKWAAQRQMSVEGGFQGRTNKLVDGCYSFWVGALFPLLDHVIRQHAAKDESKSSQSKLPSLIPSHGWLFDGRALQKYLLVCCQYQRGGGLIDKPGKGPDYYHTAYCLSGLSIAQNQDTDIHSFTLGVSNNRLRCTDPIYNIETSRLPKAMAYFAQIPTLEATSTSTSTTAKPT